MNEIKKQFEVEPGAVVVCVSYDKADKSDKHPFVLDLSVDQDGIEYLTKLEYEGPENRDIAFITFGQIQAETFYAKAMRLINGPAISRQPSL